MAWIVNKRIQRGIEYKDDVDATQKWGRFSMAPLHYEGAIDSGEYDTAIDCTPQRITAGGNDGWRVIYNGYHYFLGQPSGKATDGWVGYGGRQGQNWLQFRLRRTIYLRWSTREWVDIAGAPDYDRANLSRETKTKSVGPGSETANVEGSAVWRDVWNTPGGGELYIQWRVNGDQLKEEVVINQAGREWIETNRPPSWAFPGVPLTDVWFGFVFVLDVSDIPRWYKGAVLQDIEGDFDDSDSVPIAMRDELDRLLGLLPIDDVVAGTKGRAGGGIDASPLRKRIWKEGSDYYLLVGVRTDVLNGMRAGPLTFDPTFNVANTNRDGQSEGTDEHVNPSTTTYGAMYLGRDDSIGAPGSDDLDGGWQYVTTIDDDPTINTASMALDDAGGDRSLPLAGAWWGFDIDTPTDFNASDSHRISDHHTRTSASVTDNINTAGNHTSPDLSTIIQEIVDRGGVGANPRIGVTWRNSGGTNRWYEFSDYSDSAALAADLTVTWTSGGVTVALDALTLAGSAPNTSVAAGPASVGLSALTLAGSAVGSSVGPGPVTMALNGLTLAGSVPNSSIGAGVVSVGLNALTLTGSVPGSSIGGGAVGVGLNALALAGSAPNLAVGAGAIGVTLNALTLAGSAPNLSVAVGASTIILNALTLASSAVGTAIGAGPVSVALSALGLTGSAPNLSVDPGAVSPTLSALTLAGSAPGLTVDAPAGGATIGLNALTLAGSAPGLSVGAGAVVISLDALTLAITIQAITIGIAGKVDVTLTDVAAYKIALSDSGGYKVVVSDSGGYVVVLSDASREGS